jgi:hypothetical protein
MSVLLVRGLCEHSQRAPGPVFLVLYIAAVFLCLPPSARIVAPLFSGWCGNTPAGSSGCLSGGGDCGGDVGGRSLLGRSLLDFGCCSSLVRFGVDTVVLGRCATAAAGGGGGVL